MLDQYKRREGLREISMAHPGVRRLISTSVNVSLESCNLAGVVAKQNLASLQNERDLYM